MAAEKGINTEVRSNLESYKYREKRREGGQAGSLAHAWVLDEQEPGVGSALWTARQWYGPVVSCIGTVCCRFVH